MSQKRKTVSREARANKLNTVNRGTRPERILRSLSWIWMILLHVHWGTSAISAHYYIMLIFTSAKVDGKAGWVLQINYSHFDPSKHLAVLKLSNFAGLLTARRLTSTANYSNQFGNLWSCQLHNQIYLLHGDIYQVSRIDCYTVILRAWWIGAKCKKFHSLQVGLLVATKRLIYSLMVRLYYLQKVI